MRSPFVLIRRFMTVKLSKQERLADTQSQATHRIKLAKTKPTFIAIINQR